MFNDAASLVSHSAFSSFSKPEESTTSSSSDDEAQNERRLTKAERKQMKLQALDLRKRELEDRMAQL